MTIFRYVTGDLIQETAQFPSAVLARLGTKSIGNNSVTVLDGFTGETRDTDAFHDTVTNNGRITIPTGFGGLYLMSYGTTWATGGTAGYRAAWMAKNGDDTRRYGRCIQSENSGPSSGGCDVVPLAAGDYVEIRLFQVSGGALNAGDAVNYCFFNAVRLCA